MQVIHFGQIVIPALVENSNFEAKKIHFDFVYTKW